MSGFADFETLRFARVNCDQVVLFTTDSLALFNHDASFRSGKLFLHI
jgi:hypothetical protein